MKYTAYLTVIIAFIASAMSLAGDSTVTTIQEYYAKLPKWGISWKAGNGAENGYYPSFYTGFAMRSEFPSRIHIRLARGNQTRVSVILDQQTISDYLFDLKTRYDVYAKMTSGSKAKLNITPKGASVMPHLDYFNGIIESPVYGIIPTVKSAKGGGLSDVELYTKSLEVLSALNPGRVFNLNIDLSGEFNKWRASYQGQNGAEVAGDSKQAITAIDSLVWGRINYTEKPSSEILALLEDAVNKTQADDEAFQTAAMALFKALSGNKYDIKVVGADGRWNDAIQCASATQCRLVYPEFTAIYPTGSYDAYDKDQFGNSMARFATVGLWKFVDHGGGVDRIREEPFYGWIPKMDYQGYNGFHNPAVRNSAKDSVKEKLGIQKDHKTLWVVSRSGISHGCSRLPAGHAWELRQIVPVEADKFEQVRFFGSKNSDFDLYDIDGDGQLEVMGVDYAIWYGKEGSSGLSSREGKNLVVLADAPGRLQFYEQLYGKKSVYTVDAEGKLSFIDPSYSMPSYLDLKQRSKVAVRVDMKGQFPLYEQAYEKDKLQLYSQVSDKVIQLMGRIRGCAPTSDKNDCGAKAFESYADDAGINLAE